MSAVTRRGWLLFAAMSVIWGVPYLLIKVAVEDLSPPVVVFGRTSIAAVALLAAAWRTGALAPALRRWRPVLAFAAIEMAGPWWCLTHAEQRLPSGLTGLLVACVPIAGAFTAFALGDRDALKPVRLLGIGVGMGGVALLVAHDLGAHGGVPWWSVVEVLAVCVGYATAPFIAARSLADVPTIGVIAVSLTAVALVYAPLAWFRRPDEAPPADAVWAVVGLAVLCTGIAFLVFFALIAEIGPARAPLITFVNPAVAIVLGALILDERITGATVGGFVLVLGGCWLATRPTGTVSTGTGPAVDPALGAAGAPAGPPAAGTGAAPAAAGTDAAVPRPPADLTADLRRLGVAPGDVVMVHASLRALGPVVGRGDGVVAVLDAAVGAEGTLLMTVGASDDWSWVNERPEAERAALLADAEPFDFLRTPSDPSVGVLAEVFRTTRGTVASDHPEGRFAARGRRAFALVTDVPWHDYYGTDSPLDRLVAMGGKVLRLGADPDTVTLFHLAEFLADLPAKRRVRRHRLVPGPDGPTVRVVETFDDDDGIVEWPGGDYFVDILEAYRATGRATVGTVGDARSELLDAADAVVFAERWMVDHLA